MGVTANHAEKNERWRPDVIRSMFVVGQQLPEIGAVCQIFELAFCSPKNIHQDTDQPLSPICRRRMEHYANRYQ